MKAIYSAALSTVLLPLIAAKNGSNPLVESGKLQELMTEKEFVPSRIRELLELSVDR